MHTYICTHIYACIGMCTHDKNKYRDSQTGDAGSILEGRRWPRKTESRVFPSYPSTNTLSSPLLIWRVMFNLTLWGGGDRSQRGSTKSLQAIGWWWCTKCLSFSPPHKGGKRREGMKGLMVCFITRPDRTEGWGRLGMRFCWDICLYCRERRSRTSGTKKTI